MPKPLSAAQIADEIAKQIRTGHYRPGQWLPSYKQLAEKHKVSVATIARAIALLRWAGLVQGSPGRGTYVTEATDQ